MKKFFIMVLTVGMFVSLLFSAQNQMPFHSMMHQQQNGISSNDKRISLGLPQFARDRLLKNMREHLKAIHDITGLMAKDQFDKAALIAKNKLGLTDAMLKECQKMKREDYTSLGLAFHKSADKLSKALKEKDAKKSLLALSNTLNYCVSCHATFRQ
jgi:hypothetical protein